MKIRDAVSADAAGIARVRVDTWRQAYAGMMPEDYLSNLSYEETERRLLESYLPPRSSEQFMIVAVDEQETIIGYTIGGPNRDENSEYQGEIYSIYILPGYQHFGTGASLLKGAVERLIERKIQSMIIWVVAQNPARGFYEALGGKIVNFRDRQKSSFILAEVAYGWKDFKLFLKMRTTPDKAVKQ